MSLDTISIFVSILGMVLCAVVIGMRLRSVVDPSINSYQVTVTKLDGQKETLLVDPRMGEEILTLSRAAAERK
jgi:hypothetical protein